MLWWVWIGLGIGGLAAVGGMAFAGVRGLAAWRQFKRTSRELEDRLGRLGRDADALGAKAEGLGAASDRLTAAFAQLAASRRRLDVLLQAVEDARDTFGRITAAVPRK